MSEYTTISLDSIGRSANHRGKYDDLWKSLLSLGDGMAIQLDGDRKVQWGVYNALNSRTRGNTRRVRTKRIDDSRFALWVVNRA